MKWVGKSVERKDARVKVTGQAKYADDLYAPGMLYCKMLRSPVSHARILNIDVSRAKALPGVKAVVTGKDFPGIPFGVRPDTRDQLSMPITKIHHFGEGLVAVAAVDEDTAEEALDLIRVEYEELPPILSIDDALNPDLPPVNEFRSTNIAYESHFEFGDVEQGFRKADYIKEETFTSQRVSVGFIEPHACLAQVDASGRILLQASKQSPYITWRHICRALDIPLSKLRIVNPYVGGAFSGKHDPFDIDFAVIKLAQLTGRPVKAVLTYDEVLAAYRQRNSMRVTMKIGAKKDGTITALEARCYLQGGPYSGIGPFNVYFFGAFLPVPYKVPAVRYDGYLLYSNLPPCGTVRGQEIVLSQYARDVLLDIVAADLDLDPVEMRLKNAVDSGYRTVNGIYIDVSGLKDCIKKVAERIGWENHKKTKRPNVGIGFSCAGHPSGPRLGGHFGSSVVIKLEEDGKVIVTHGGTELGQGVNTVMCQIVAEVLGIDYEDVLPGVSDSDTTIFDSGMFGDRCTFWTGNAAIRAAEDLKRQLAEIVAKDLGCSPEELVFENRAIYSAKNPEKKVDFLLAARRAYYEYGQPLYGRGYWAATDIEIVDWKTGKGNLTHGISFIATAVEVEVDPETGVVRPTRVACAKDSGQPINPMLLDGQVIGGTVHALGHALYEQVLYDDKGRILNYTWRDYKQPVSMDVPEFVVDHIITTDPYGPFGAKGGGETSTCSTLAAVVNAVHDATGLWIKDLPVTPEKVLRGLKDMKG